MLCNLEENFEALSSSFDCHNVCAVKTAFCDGFIKTSASELALGKDLRLGIGFGMKGGGGGGVAGLHGLNWIPFLCM